jgi:hypothetical protein
MKKMLMFILLFFLSFSIYSQQACPGTSNITQGYMIFVIKGNILINGSLPSGVRVITLDTNAGGTFDVITIICASNLYNQCVSLPFAQTVEFSGVILPQECPDIFPYPEPNQLVRFKANELRIIDVN